MDPLGIVEGDGHLFVFADANPLVNFDLLGLDFTNNTQFPLCVWKGDQWQTVPAGKSIEGDADGVANRKGREWKDKQGRRDRVFKWVDCFDAVANDIPQDGVSIDLILRPFDERASIADPKKRAACVCVPHLAQKFEGGPKNPRGPIPDWCP